jgi:subtilisin family serine protease
MMLRRNLGYPLRVPTAQAHSAGQSAQSTHLGSRFVMVKLHPLFIALASAGFVASASAESSSLRPFSQTAAAVAQGKTYIITFVEPGLLYNDGQNGAFMATAPSASGSRKLDAQSMAALSYRDYLTHRQDQYLSEMERVIARTLQPSHRYDITMNGMAVSLTAEEAAKVQTIAGVKSVEAEQIYELVTDAGPAFIQAPSMWTGAGTFSGAPTRGEGVVVGVFDTGGNPDHPSFANDASCGFSIGTPKVIATKDCNTANCATGNGEDVSFFVDATNTGSSGHGVHTASTAAGGAVAAGTMVNGIPARFNISGVAPCARLITYKVCGDTAPSGAAGCGGAAIAAAIQTSIVDQVDVVNFSISGGTSPWTDNDRGFLDMNNADILVAASAGNTRTATPNPVGAVNHRGPWVMTVANTSHDRVVTNPVSVAGSLQNVPSQATSGLQFTSTITADVGNAVALGNEYGCTASGGFAAGSMTGKIALIQRGPPAPATACSFIEKINNATTAGAIGAVIYDRTTGAPLNMDVTTAPGTTIPAVFIRQAAGYTLRDFLVANPAAQMTIVAPSQRVIDPGVADVLNASSLRGPNTTFDITKPDITGPGTNIYAASSGNFGEFIFLTGTSMSSPHLAGAAALLRSAQPTWTVQEVKSAIQLTASPNGRKDNELTPWDADDVGNGRIDLSKAARSGLVMNETFANFVAANPSTAGTNAVRQLNLPSLRHTAIAGSYVFTRTFRNAYGNDATWTADTSGAPAGTTVTVSPSSFFMGSDPNQTRTVQITVTVTAPIATLAFGDVEFTPTLGPGDNIFKSGFETGEQPVQAPLAPVPVVRGSLPQPPFPVRLTLAVQGNP